MLLQTFTNQPQIPTASHRNYLEPTVLGWTICTCSAVDLISNTAIELASAPLDVWLVCVDAQYSPYVGCMPAPVVAGPATVGTLVGMAGLWSRWLRGLALCGCYGQLAGRAGSDG